MSVTATFARIPLIAIANTCDPVGILVFRTADTGNVASQRMIVGPLTTLSSPSSIAVVNDQLVVADRVANAIDVFSADADHDVAPVRRIVGGSTGLNGPSGVSISGGEIYIAQPNTITGLTTVGGAGPTSLLVSDDEVFVADDVHDQISVFPLDASGAATPSRVISHATPPSTDADLNAIFEIATLNGELYVASFFFDTIEVFPTGSSGPTLPTRTIDGVLAWPLSRAVGVHQRAESHAPPSSMRASRASRLHDLVIGDFGVGSQSG